MTFDIPKFGEMLKNLPLAILAALTASGLFILYAPHFPGLDLSAARKWPWTAPLTLLAGFLLLFQVIDKVARSWVRVTSHLPTRTLTLTVHSQVNTTWWHRAPQPNGDIVTQMVANISAYNPSHAPVRITTARLVKPTIPAIEMLPVVFAVEGRPGHQRVSSQHTPVFPRSNTNIHVVLMANRQLGRPGKFIHAVIGLTDQNGYEHKVKVRMWPNPPSP